jgi:hypothetical protein
VSLAGTAAAGVLVGHWLAYAAALPRGPIQIDTLAATGHGYWALAVKLAVVLLVAAIGAVVVQRLGDPPGADAPRPLRFSWAAIRLGSLQLVVFLAMESVERLAVGAPVGSLFAHHVLLLGVAAQVVVAFAAALLLVLLDRGARALVATLRGTRAGAATPARHWVPPRLSLLHRPAVLAGAAGLRSPPRV